MLKLYCLSTGSNGNCYLLKHDNKILVLDLGVRYSSFLTALDRVEDLCGVLITHHHSDHDYKGSKLRNSEIVKTYTEVLTPENVEIGNIYVLNDFKIIPVEHKHNVKCYGYLIKIDDEIIYYATDTNYPIQFDNIKINHFIVECNYIEELRQTAMLKSNADMVHLKNIYENHCSLETLVDYFNKLNYKPDNILIIHGSNSNLFLRDVVEQKLEPFAKNVKIVFNGRNYILRG